MHPPAVALADLLSVLHHLQPHEHAAATLACGYVLVPSASAESAPPILPELRPPEPGLAPELSAPPPAPDAASAGQLPVVHWRVSEDRAQPSLPATVPAWLGPGGQAVNQQAAFVSNPNATRPPHRPLASAARRQAALRRMLASPNEGAAIDVSALVAACSRGQAVRRLPRLQRPRWPARVQVLLDQSRRLQPLQEDHQLWLASLQKTLGTRLRWAVVQGQPVTTSSDGGAVWPVRCDGTPVLVLGDLGMAQAQGGTARLWAGLGKAVRDAGGRLFALGLLPPRLAARPVPAPWQSWQVNAQRVGPSPRVVIPITASTGLYPATSTAAANVSHQSSGGMAQPPLTRPTEQTLPSAQQALLAALLGNADVSARLLRSLRLALQQGGFKLDVGHEVELWHSPFVQSDSRACQLTTEGAQQARLWWQQLPADLRNELCAVHWRHLQAGSPLLRAEYALALQRGLGPGCPMEVELAAGRQAGEQLMRQAAALQWQSAGRSDLSGLSTDLQDFFRAQSQQQPDLLDQAGDNAQGWQWAWALAHREDWHQWAQGTPPPWLGPDVAAVVAQPARKGPALALTVQNTSHFGASRLNLSAQQPGRAALSNELANARARVQVRPPKPDLALSLGLARLPAERWQAELQRLLGGALGSDDEAFQTVRLALENPPQPGGLAFEHWHLELHGLLRRARAQQAEHKTGAWGGLGADLSASPLALDGLQAGCWVQAGGGVELPAAGAALAQGLQVHVTLPRRMLSLEPVARPAWCDAMWQEGTAQRASGTDGQQLVWVPQGNWLVEGNSGETTHYMLPHGFWWDLDEAEDFYFSKGARLRCPTWAARHGVDDFGYWAEFEIEPPASQLASLSSAAWQGLLTTQRMRFIPPGQFWRGSPVAEAGRLENEELSRVTLTRGCWLADTACTQRLWARVVGYLPERQLERGDDLPVVNVSHDDIRENFFPALARLVPGLQAQLPTEAQWEMAARAGTTTAYPWGDTPSLKHMNFGAFKKKGASRPLAVQQFNANAWGLWQMHGNVWEWCADAQAERFDADALDPWSETGARRVLRGGSWFNYSRSCRAASRIAYDPGSRLDTIGFRLARGLPEAGRAEPGAGRGAPFFAAEPARPLQPGDSAPGSQSARPAPASALAPAPNPTPAPKSPRQVSARSPEPPASRAEIPGRRPTTKK